MTAYTRISTRPGRPPDRFSLDRLVGWDLTGWHRAAGAAVFATSAQRRCSGCAARGRRRRVEPHAV